MIRKNPLKMRRSERSSSIIDVMACSGSRAKLSLSVLGPPRRSQGMSSANTTKPSEIQVVRWRDSLKISPLSTPPKCVLTAGVSGKTSGIVVAETISFTSSFHHVAFPGQHDGGSRKDGGIDQRHHEQMCHIVIDGGLGAGGKDSRACQWRDPRRRQRVEI